MPTFTDPTVVMPSSGMWASSVAGIVQANVIDAAAEYLDQYGHIHWVGDPQPASKVVSSAGGAIVSVFGAVTFNNGGTNLRIGIQDVDAATGRPARGDGTHDVQADLVGGTDTITASTARNTPMESGTKTISEGAIICVRHELTTRGGADSLALNSISAGNDHLPGVTHNSGVVANVLAVPNVIILADDGTVGYILGGGFCETFVTRTFDSGTGTFDEYASLVSWPFPVIIYGIYVRGRVTTAGGVLEVLLYSDPLGTPVAERTSNLDTDRESGVATQGAIWAPFSTPYTVPANTTIALSCRPSTATSDVSMTEWDIGAISQGTNLYKGLGGTWSKGSRLDNTGAFTQDTGAFESIGALISGIDTGTAFTINTAQMFSQQSGVASGARF